MVFKIGDKYRKNKEPWNKGKKGVYSEETLEKMRNAAIGHKVSDETKRKSSKSHKGLISGNKGKKHPELFGDSNPAKRPEVREKISLKKSGVNHHNYGKVGDQTSNWKDGRSLDPLYHKKYAIRIKLLVLNHYSNNDCQCNCCGENHIEFLQIDHIDCGNSYHGKNRRPNKFYGIRLYKWLIDNNYPNGYQVLCSNCNFAKGMYGKCPHEEE